MKTFEVDIGDEMGPDYIYIDAEDAEEAFDKAFTEYPESEGLRYYYNGILDLSDIIKEIK